MESKRLKTEALEKAREFIDDHPFQLKPFKIGSLATTREFIDAHPFQHGAAELKSFKIGSLATTREFIDVHPFRSISGAAYTAPIMSQAGAVSSPPFELKSFKIGSLATTREFIDVHPFQPISGAVYTAPIMNQAGAVSSPPFELKSLKIGSLAMTRQFIGDHPLQSISGSSASMPSPSGRPMNVVDRSRRNRTAEQMEEQIEASRQHHIITESAGHHRRQAAFKSIEQYWDYKHPCAHCGRVWLRDSSVGLRKKYCQGGRVEHNHGHHNLDAILQ